MYVARRLSIWTKVKCFFSKKYRDRHEQEQMRIIREMVTIGKHEPVIWP